MPAAVNSIEIELRKVQDEIEELEKKVQRAQSQAQITRAGFIYVISNIGSFGEGIVKIGMISRNRGTLQRRHCCEKTAQALSMRILRHGSVGDTDV